MYLRFVCSLSIILLMFRLIQSLAFKTLPFFGGQLEILYIRITRYQDSRLLDASGHVKVKPLLFPTKCDDDSPDMDFQKCIFQKCIFHCRFRRVCNRHPKCNYASFNRVFLTGGSDEHASVKQNRPQCSLH